MTEGTSSKAAFFFTSALSVSLTFQGGRYSLAHKGSFVCGDRLLTSCQKQASQNTKETDKGEEAANTGGLTKPDSDYAKLPG